MPSETPVELVERYFDAILARDDVAVRTCLADRGFLYQSPIGTFTDADAFSQFVSMTGGILYDIERRRTFADGDDVCHWLVFLTQMSERISTPAVQWARVKDGRIVSIELLFDPYRYRRLFDVDGGTTTEQD